LLLAAGCVTQPEIVYEYVANARAGGSGRDVCFLSTIIHTQTPLYRTWSGTTELSFARITRRDTVTSGASRVFENHPVTLQRHVDTVWFYLEGPLYDTLSAARGEDDEWYGDWTCDTTYPLSDSITVAEPGTWYLIGQAMPRDWQ
jgi:hypothetical protein